MKQEIDNLVVLMDSIIKTVLSHTKDIRTQAQLLKNREELKQSLEKLECEYDSIIKILETKINEK